MCDRSTDGFAAICSRMEDNALIAAECRNLTGGIPDGAGVALCETVEQVPDAAYVRTGLQLLARGATVDDLVRAVDETDIAADDFRIEIHASADGYYNSRQTTIVALADVLPAYPDLDDPQHRFLVFAHKNELWFGEIVTECDHTYVRHDAKPCRTSFSLSSRLSRGLVNLVTPAETLLDPCCGTGSILLEAQSRGIQAYGADWNQTMVQMANENLSHFGYDERVEHADARSYSQPADAIVTDLPYGQFLQTDAAVIRAILKHGARLAPVAVYVAGALMTEWLEAAGYHDIRVYPVVKRAGFVRYVHVARSDQ